MIVVTTTKTDRVFKDIVHGSNSKKKRGISTGFNITSYLHLCRNRHTTISTVGKCNHRAHRVHGDGLLFSFSVFSVNSVVKT